MHRKPIRDNRDPMKGINIAKGEHDQLLKKSSEVKYDENGKPITSHKIDWKEVFSFTNIAIFLVSGFLLYILITNFL